MGSLQQNIGGGWFIDYGVGDEPCPADFLWPSRIVKDPVVARMVAGLAVDSHKDAGNIDASSSRKRNRMESCAEPGTKACREKLRRDKLNDRFSELASILDPGKPSAPEKAAVLSDAIIRLNQLRLEVQTLKESNFALHEGIKNVKVEKVELRDEKARLKAEKEQLDQILEGMRSTQTTFIPQPAVPSARHPATYATFGKTVPYTNCPPVAMWQWMPPAVTDTSQDHVLRSPVA